ncbi:MAG: prepilin-type N-terminal cleavage/methylation domain-containing protein [Bacilli bacterium]|nr:prepilin-type N-terminal cleavage/methylation domain-containing protein [Bacilli bacterium]
MKRSRKGFTLVELLAVIVILAIIALIATPIIVGAINKAKKDAFLDTAYGVLKAGEFYYAKGFGIDVPGKKVFSFPDDFEELKLSGEKIGGGSLEVTSDGMQSLAIYDKGKNWCATKGEEDSEVTVVKYEEGNCKISETNGFLPKNLSKGTAVYLNPETKKVCNAEEAISTTGTKKGCMKWYAYKDNGNGTYQLILDHNTTAVVAWNSSNNNREMKEIQVTLENDTKTWNSSLNVRIISADEIAKITDNTDFDAKSATEEKWFYFDSNSQVQTITKQGQSLYSWLYDYTDICTTYGCNVADSLTQGYWTDTFVYGTTNNAWRVYRYGGLFYNNVNTSNLYGIRPVITI